MPYHTVQQGECLSKIAKEAGFADWRTIYDHPENSAFRCERPNPNVICRGDRLFVPDKIPKEETVQTEQIHRFRLKQKTPMLRIVVRDITGEPLANKKYRLLVEEIVDQEGIIPADGLIEQNIPPDAEQGRLMIWMEGKTSTQCYTWELRIGHLDPVETLSGVQARLNNLAFNSGPVDGKNGPKTKAAVQAFQKKHALTVDGIAGPQTQHKLKEVYGC